MENIADALRIAAGVLLATLLLSLLVYVFRSFHSVEEERAQQILIEQIKEFNGKFLAYNKTQMYGTDVMSVLSLAIDNNRDINSERALHNRDGRYDPNKDGSVNIKIYLNPVDMVKSKKYKKTIDYREDPVLITTEDIGSPTNYFQGLFKTGGYLDLTDSGTVEKFSDMVIDDSKTIEQSYKRKEHGLVEEITIVDNYGIEDFKKAVFTCTDVKYNDGGRIYEMTFVNKDYE